MEDMKGLLEDAFQALLIRLIEPDEMSFHGELMRCNFCSRTGTRAGFKRGVGDNPINHRDDCILSRLAKELDK